MIVGIELIWYWSASSCCASVSTLANVMSGCFSEARSKTGANRTHGPHHDAQKSTRTMPSPTVCSKFSDVNATVVIAVLRSMLGTQPITSYPLPAFPTRYPAPWTRGPAHVHLRRRLCLLHVLRPLHRAPHPHPGDGAGLAVRRS